MSEQPGLRERAQGRFTMLRGAGGQFLLTHPKLNQIVDWHSKAMLWELIFVPWLVLVLVLILFLFSGSGQDHWLVIGPLILVAIDSLFLYNRYKVQHSAEIVLGLLVFIAVLAGVAVGGFAHDSFLSEYYRLGEGASYSNVWPQQKASGMMDATSLVFAPGSAVDTLRTYGFVNGHSAIASNGHGGDIYCVAPVWRGEGSAEPRVQFWAAGLNCCEPRGAFRCGQASSSTMVANKSVSTTLGAVVLAQKEQADPMFRAAVHGASATYGLQSGDDYLLLRWSLNPVDHFDSLWTRVRNLFLVFGGVYFVVSVVLGSMMMTLLK